MVGKSVSTRNKTANASCRKIRLVLASRISIPNLQCIQKTRKWVEWSVLCKKLEKLSKHPEDQRDKKKRGGETISVILSVKDGEKFGPAVGFAMATAPVCVIYQRRVSSESPRDEITFTQAECLRTQYIDALKKTHVQPVSTCFVLMLCPFSSGQTKSCVCLHARVLNATTDYGIDSCTSILMTRCSCTTISKSQPNQNVTKIFYIATCMELDLGCGWDAFPHSSTDEVMNLFLEVGQVTVPPVDSKNFPVRNHSFDLFAGTDTTHILDGLPDHAFSSAFHDEANVQDSIGLFGKQEYMPLAHDKDGPGQVKRQPFPNSAAGPRGKAYQHLSASQPDVSLSLPAHHTVQDGPAPHLSSSSPDIPLLVPLVPALDDPDRPRPLTLGADAHSVNLSSAMQYSTPPPSGFRKTCNWCNQIVLTSRWADGSYCRRQCERLARQAQKREFPHARVASTPTTLKLSSKLSSVGSPMSSPPSSPSAADCLRCRHGLEDIPHHKGCPNNGKRKRTRPSYLPSAVGQKRKKSGLMNPKTQGLQVALTQVGSAAGYVASSTPAAVTSAGYAAVTTPATAVSSVTSPDGPADQDNSLDTPAPMPPLESVPVLPALEPAGPVPPTPAAVVSSSFYPAEQQPPLAPSSASTFARSTSTITSSSPTKSARTLAIPCAASPARTHCFTSPSLSFSFEMSSPSATAASPGNTSHASSFASSPAHSSRSSSFAASPIKIPNSFASPPDKSSSLSSPSPHSNWRQQCSVRGRSSSSPSPSPYASPPLTASLPSSASFSFSSASANDLADEDEMSLAGSPPYSPNSTPPHSPVTPPFPSLSTSSSSSPPASPVSSKPKKGPGQIQVCLKRQHRDKNGNSDDVGELTWLNCYWGKGFFPSSVQLRVQGVRTTYNQHCVRGNILPMQSVAWRKQPVPASSPCSQSSPRNK
eukprot:g15129.t1